MPSWSCWLVEAVFGSTRLFFTRKVGVGEVNLPAVSSWMTSGVIIFSNNLRNSRLL